MPALPTLRPSLCLFCAFKTVVRRRTQRLLLPHVQVAHRTSGAAKKSWAPLDKSQDRFSLTGRSNSTREKQPKLQASFVVDTFRKRLEALRLEFVDPVFLESLSLTRNEFDQQWLSFERSINMMIKNNSPKLQHLIKAHYGRGIQTNKKIDSQLRYLFYAQAYNGRFTNAELDNQKEVADLRFPTEWYPATREISRAVHLHVGPTNSGKTYHALKRLEEAESGIYLGPLRLLAHEVYARLNAKGKPCALITGEEQRLPEGHHKMWSCTVEMAPLNERMDVAVIDEIQMINHEDRGWAWTQAFLGIQASEVHLCGEARTVPLIKALCALVGDTVHVHEYERLTPLKIADRSLNGKLQQLEKGDCIVSFSVIGIHALRREVEQKTGKKVAIVYGSLPPETRAQQARLFNDPDNDYDFLVASDAIGMGLNLSIKRVIFESIMKNNGSKLVPLQISEIKQIGGRAGRYKTAHQAIAEDNAETPLSDVIADPVIGLDDKPKVENENTTVGYVTTLDQVDFQQLSKRMQREADVIETAGLFPPSLIIERFANYFPPGTPFGYILLRLHEVSNIHPRFHLCNLKDQLAIADSIHLIKNLSIQDRIMFCSAPTNLKGNAELDFLRELALCIAENKSGELLDLQKLPLEILDEPLSYERRYLFKLEQLHKMLVLYLWLSFRYPNVFTSRNLANYTTKLTEKAIEQTLSQFSYSMQDRLEMLRKREKAIHKLVQPDHENKSTNEMNEPTRTGHNNESIRESELPSEDISKMRAPLRIDLTPDQSDLMQPRIQ